MRKWAFILIMISTAFVKSVYGEVHNYQHDDQGRIVEENWHNTRYDNDEKYTYTYSGDTYTKTHYVGNDIHSKKSVFTYDDEGDSLFELTYDYSYGGEGTLYSRFYDYTTTINENGQKIKTGYRYYCAETAECSADNGVLEEIDVYQYESTDDGFKRVVDFYGCDSSVCDEDPYDGNVEVYDQHGNKIFDWYLGVIYQYKYNKYGGIEQVKSQYCDEDTDECLALQKDDSYWEDVELSQVHTYDPKYLNNQWLKHRKLIYTLEEANAVAKPTGNTVRIKYR